MYSFRCSALVARRNGECTATAALGDARAGVVRGAFGKTPPRAAGHPGNYGAVVLGRRTAPISDERRNRRHGERWSARVERGRSPVPCPRNGCRVGVSTAYGLARSERRPRLRADAGASVRCDLERDSKGAGREGWRGCLRQVRRVPRLRAATASQRLSRRFPRRRALGTERRPSEMPANRRYLYTSERMRSTASTAF